MVVYKNRVDNISQWLFDKGGIFYTLRRTAVVYHRVKQGNMICRHNTKVSELWGYVSGALLPYWLGSW